MIVRFRPAVAPRKPLSMWNVTATVSTDCARLAGCRSILVHSSREDGSRRARERRESEHTRRSYRYSRRKNNPYRQAGGWKEDRQEVAAQCAPIAHPAQSTTDSKGTTPIRADIHFSRSWGDLESKCLLGGKPENVSAYPKGLSEICDRCHNPLLIFCT